VGAAVGGERVDEDGRDLGWGEAALEGLAHHRRAVPLADGVRFADPDVDGAMAGPMAPQ
jgi:hypothetical protein